MPCPGKVGPGSKEETKGEVLVGPGLVDVGVWGCGTGRRMGHINHTVSERTKYNLKPMYPIGFGARRHLELR